MYYSFLEWQGVEPGGDVSRTEQANALDHESAECHRELAADHIECAAGVAGLWVAARHV
jgi:hypothetical protein